MALPLAQEHGIASVILEGPFYGEHERHSCGTGSRWGGHEAWGGQGRGLAVEGLWMEHGPGMGCRCRYGLNPSGVSGLVPSYRVCTIPSIATRRRSTQAGRPEGLKVAPTD